MKQRSTIRREAAQAGDIEQLLATKYSQLQRWGAVLARGDSGKAQELVQEFCLYFTLTKPDLTEVVNVDGYLYTCLRNIYLSGLARASREALHLVGIADYDSFDFALAANKAGDPLQKQNDLRRICGYTVWRKEQSKSASYFILHFFHGYSRREIAELARLPISAIYNKLKTARDEVKSHLNHSGKLRIIDRDSAPPLRISWSLLSTADLFNELRETILNARLGACLDETALLAHYASSNPSPIPCALLAHIVSCERCLNIVDGHFRRPALQDREPLDGYGSSSREGAAGVAPSSMKAEMAIFESVRRRWGRIHEHRPRTLSIAVNGKIVAFHDVQSQQSTLSARIENPEREQFVEVFSEQDVRLALMPVGELPPQGPHTMTQRVALSDSRWLELNLTFDGLGLNSQVVYYDPALAMDASDQETEDFAVDPAPIFGGSIDSSDREPDSQRAWALERWVRRLVSAVPLPAVAWTIVLALILGSGGYAPYRYMHPGWRDVLARAQAAAEVPLPSETLHQTLRIEEATGPANGMVLGSVDVWSSSDRRVVRRLYNAQQTLLATSIDSGHGAVTDRFESNASIGQKDREMAASGVWRSDLSSASFDTRKGAEADAIRESSGFEVTQREDGRNGILSRTLVMDGNYQVQAERVRFRTADGVAEVRLVQTLLRKVPNSDVPAWTFPQSQPTGTPGAQSGNILQKEGGANSTADANNANLEVMLLFELFQRNADIGQPIEVTPTSAGRIRMTGTLADAQLLAGIRESVSALPNSSRVDFQIRSVKEAASTVHRAAQSSQELVGTNSDAPAAPLVRDALIARGLKAAALKDAEKEFAVSALSHAQAALQHAYALDRLGTVLSRAGQASLDPDTRVKWAQMADRHSTAAMTELQALRLLLDSVAAGVDGIPSVDVHGIADASTFVRAASDLRMRMQSVDEQVVELFAGSAAVMPQAQAHDSIARLRAALPVAEASRMNSFASRLQSRNPSARNDVGEMQKR
jgi:DNA-directed RNA polymerase specialized sigma24 family protein